jgi:hypothetical protein
MGYCVPFRNGGVRKWDEHIWLRYVLLRLLKRPSRPGVPVGSRSVRA